MTRRKPIDPRVGDVLLIPVKVVDITGHTPSTAVIDLCADAGPFATLRVVGEWLRANGRLVSRKEGGA